MHYCYILYSKILNSFYTGETSDINLRLQQHNNQTFHKSYTAKANDWTLFLLINCDDRVHARKVEKFIKSMKSKQFIFSLKDNCEKVVDIVNKCKRA